MRRKTVKIVKHIPVYILLSFVVVLILMPLFWMFNSSFKAKVEILAYPPTFFAKAASMVNFEKLARRIPVLAYVKNSVIYALLTAVPGVFINSLAGYAFARLKFKGRNILFIITLATMMIPFQVVMIPLYLVVHKLGMYDTYAGLILPKMANAISIFMMRSAFSGLPVELEESGRIDGVSEFGLFWRIMLPQCKPTIVTLIILGVNGAWNDLVWPLLVTGDISMRTLSNGLALFVGTDTVEYGAAFAGALISILPMLVLYLIGQRYFVEGTVTSGLKG